MLKYLIRAYAAVLAIFLLTGCGGNTGRTGDAKAQVFNANEGIVSQGVIQAKEVSINTKIPGRILKLSIEEGSEVNAGDAMVEIGSEELKAKEEQAIALIASAKASFDAARGQTDAANALLRKAENGARSQEVAQAQSYYDLMVKTFDRVDKLFEKGAVSAQKRDEVKTQLDVAEQQLSIAKEGARSEDKSGANAVLAQALAMQQAAKGKLEQAEAGLTEIRAYLKDTKILAPISGTVTVLNSHEGELVSTGMSIATVSDISVPWVEVKLKETDLEKIQLGYKVDVKVPGYSQKLFSGKVVRISQKPDFATKRATNDNGDFDILSFGVKIEIENPEKSLRPGMTAFVQFKR